MDRYADRTSVEQCQEVRPSMSLVSYKEGYGRNCPSTVFLVEARQHRKQTMLCRRSLSKGLPLEIF